MQVVKLSYPAPPDRLETLISLTKSSNLRHELGTAFLQKGTRMPDDGKSTHSRHEVSVILEGKLSTTAGGITTILEAGDIVSIPAGEPQFSLVLEDTRLIYVFFDD
ncbi:cupin domain-containing protein [Paremcibacter congregatus]|uniref:cupin domain-containing protein n=1 Tax=Paremcibacter congregatus TaxID=2043170 RepID=UPI003A92FF52